MCRVILPTTGVLAQSDRVEGLRQVGGPTFIVDGEESL